MEADPVNLDIINQWLKAGAGKNFWPDSAGDRLDNGELLADSIPVAPARPALEAPAYRLPEHEIACFGDHNEYRLIMAVAEPDRLACWRLVYQEYLGLGYSKPSAIQYRYSIHDALPDTATFLVERSGEAVGVVTVIPDSPLNLPADESHRDELNRMRAEGRSLAEVGRLTIRKDFTNDRQVLIGLFDALSIYARCIRRATDLVITVNPSHARYYERMLLFERRGEERSLGSVCGAPAVLLRLDLDLERRMRRYTHGEGPKPAEYADGRTFYPWVPGESEEGIRASRMIRARARPAESFLKRYFVKLRPLIPNLPASLQYLFEKCYPDYDLLGARGWNESSCHS